MQTKVVFIQTVDGIAKASDVQVVSAGYARISCFRKNLPNRGQEQALRAAEMRRAKGKTGE